jgi:hypothetical protein
MPLFLAEFTLPPDGERDATFDRIEDAVRTAGAELIELQIGLDFGLLYAVAEAEGPTELERGLAAAETGLHGVVEVRLVGPSLDEVKAARGDAGYLVEWDLPEGLTMDRYLERKRSKAPGYAKVPETTFLRTYVCTDMSKCLCFYRAPDEAAVLRARAAVETPVDRVSRIEEAPSRVRA